MKSTRTKRDIPAIYLVAAGILVAALAAYMVLVRPTQGKASTTEAEVENVDMQITTIQRQLAAEAEEQNFIEVADLVELAKAMPDDDGQAAAMLGLIDAAQGAGVNFTAIQPGTPIPLVGYTRYPMALSFIGNYYDLTEFLYRLRNGVTVRDGVLDATSRLFTVDTVNWHASDEEDEKFPLVQADLIVSAYVYGSDVDLVTAQVAADAAGEEQPATTGTEPGSTTTPTEPGSTAPAGSEQAAAGATP